MKKSILVLALFALSSNLAHSEEGEPELTQASSEYVMNVTPCVRIVVASINLLNKQGAVSNQQCITKGIQANLKKQY